MSSNEIYPWVRYFISNYLMRSRVDLPAQATRKLLTWMCPHSNHTINTIFRHIVISWFHDILSLCHGVIPLCRTMSHGITSSRFSPSQRPCAGLDLSYRMTRSGHDSPAQPWPTLPCLALPFAAPYLALLTCPALPCPASPCQKPTH